MSLDHIPKGADGFYHPASEEELVSLVRAAYHQGRQLRVRGAAHSVSHAVYTDPHAELENRVTLQTPPQGDNLNVMLDRYCGWRVKDEARKLVEADAGIHLGDDPGDPTGTASLDNSLLSQLATEKGWTLFDTGGVTHQTVGGFTATGSSGGSLQFTADRNLWGFRIIDGRGEVHELTREDADADLFHSMVPNLGLLGVVSRITFECVDNFAVAGQEAATTLEDCSIDLFGEGSDGRPSLEQFFRDAEFSRLEWWPQRGAERVVTWQAQRLRAQTGFRPSPYQRFGADPEATQYFISVLFTILGNLGDLSRARARLEDDFDHLEEVLERLAATEGLGEAGDALASFLSQATELGVDAALSLLQPAAPLIQRTLPEFFPGLLSAFVPLDSDKEGAETGEPQSFRDWAWQGLPMDNAADDVLLPTEFTEIWVPVRRTREVMGLLREYFSESGDDHEAFRRTGTYAWELYAAMPTRFWINPSHTTGEDEWRDGAFRVDPYWFTENAENPAEGFFLRPWEMLRRAGVPFRLHWGKFHPIYPPGDRNWVDFFRAQYPRWDDFLRLRAERDPNNIFLNRYWRDRFGLWDAPEPREIPGG
jgi:D-arabinono-1,4-lactone oxidase